MSTATKTKKQSSAHETYELIDGAWRIKSMTLTRLHMDIT